MSIIEMDAFGTHGTSNSRALSILANGFELPDPGGSLRRGTGCYFWEHYDGTEHAYSLARAWWDYSTKQGQYSEDIDPSCAVIRAVISYSEDRFLDFQTIQVKRKFLEFVASLEDSVPDEEKGDEFKSICKKYDLFLDLIEEKSGRDYHVFRVQIPMGSNRILKAAAQYQLLGEPIALVVKETKCITSLEKHTA